MKHALLSILLVASFFYVRINYDFQGKEQGPFESFQVCKDDIEKQINHQGWVVASSDLFSECYSPQRETVLLSP